MTRLLTIMGSGETAPTMVKPHRSVFERMASEREREAREHRAEGELPVVELAGNAVRVLLGPGDEGLHRAAFGVSDADELATLGEVLRVDVEERRERGVRVVRGFHGRVWWS